jgi:hypothetical protein
MGDGELAQYIYWQASYWWWCTFHFCYHYLLNVSEVGLNLKVTGTETEHYFCNQEKKKNKRKERHYQSPNVDHFVSVNCKKQIYKKGYFDHTLSSAQSSSGAESSQHHVQYPSLQTVLALRQSSLLNTRINSY